MSSPQTQDRPNLSIVRIVLVVVTGMILLQVAVDKLDLTVKSQPPGEGRGDVMLQEDCLPDTIQAWHKTKFAAPAEDLPNGQYWISHSWTYTTDTLQALVAFDQADWTGWHELCECYGANGWQLKSRDIRQDGKAEWEFVVAEFARAPGTKGLLVFSLFFDDGSPVRPWRMSVSQAVKDNMGMLDRLLDRQRHMTDRANGRAYQCQVFIPFHGTLTTDTMDQAIDLHKQTRQRILNQFHEAKNQKTTP